MDLITNHLDANKLSALHHKSGLLEQESREKVSSYSTIKMESQAIDGVASKPIKEKVLPMALKANVTRGQTSNDSVCQDGSVEDEDKDEDEEGEFNSIMRNL
ncbi:hypothetical protein Tco_0421504 [Tanacetum coccineum]